jgi:hypothetical protein
MHQDSPSRVIVGNFHGPTFEMPPVPQATHRPPVDVNAYFSGNETFALHLGQPGNGLSVDVWTTEEGIVAVIKACVATLDRARLERRKAAIEASES